AARPCAVRLSLRVVRCRRVAPSLSSSAVTLRLTVETGMPSACAARLKLSNCATLTKTAMSFRSATSGLLHGCKRHSRYFHLIENWQLRQIDVPRAISPGRDQMTGKTVIITGASQGIG